MRFEDRPQRRRLAPPTAPDKGLHGDQVDDPHRIPLDAAGKLQHGGFGAQHLHNGIHTEVDIVLALVHLVQNARVEHFILVGLTPYHLRIQLQAHNTVEHTPTFRRDQSNSFSTILLTYTNTY